MNRTNPDAEYRVINNSLRDLLSILFKHKVKILFVSLLVMIPSILWVQKQPRFFQSRAKILVKEGRENTTPTATLETNRFMDITRTEDINSEIEILQSRLLIEKVVKKLGTDLKIKEENDQEKSSSTSSPIVKSTRTIFSEFKTLLRYLFPLLPSPKSGQPSFDTAVLKVQRCLNAKQVKNSNVIQVSFSDPDAIIPVDVINTLLDFYLDHHLMVHKTPGAYQFFSEQEMHYKTKLEESEKKLEDYKKKWSLAELTLQREILLRQIGFFENDLEHADSNFEELKEKISQRQQQIKSQREKIWISETSTRNPITNELTSKLSKLKLEKNRLENKYAEINHRKILEMREEIKEIETQLAESGDPIKTNVITGVNSIYQELSKSLLHNKAELEAIEAKRENIKKHIALTKDKVFALNELDLELNQLKRQIKINEESYHLYRKKVEENRISDAMDVARFANISIIEPALRPLAPLPNKKRFKIFMAILLGITAGIGAAFLSELFDHSIGNAEELESSLNLPVLGSIPNIK